MLARAVGSIGDITEQKLGEQALQESEARFRALVEHSTDIYYIVNPTGEILYRSPSAAKIFGYADADAIGHSILERVHRDDVERLAVALLSGNGDASKPSAGMVRVRHQDGSWRHISWACSDATGIAGHRRHGSQCARPSPMR
ncbi:MAG: PAS domain S-box protein [Pseudomonadota bacterium]